MTVVEGLALGLLVLFVIALLCIWGGITAIRKQIQLSRRLSAQQLQQLDEITNHIEVIVDDVRFKQEEREEARRPRLWIASGAKEADMSDPNASKAPKK